MVAKSYPNVDLTAAGGIPADTAPLKCPRCDSSNTKFCYYNNYSLAQPRHFCKACKRYWTLGGTLRNVPVGGGCRKNKRHKKPLSVPLPKASVRPSTNPPANEFRSLIYDTNNLFFLGLDLDSQIASFDETLQSGIGPDLADFRRSSEGRECFDPAMGISWGLDLSTPMESIAGTEFSHLNWNHAGVCYDWPENGSSVAPLL